MLQMFLLPSFSTLGHARSYPIAFGLRVQRILPNLTRSNSGRPCLTGLAQWDAPLAFQRLSFQENSWLEAKLMESALYLRGSLHLRVPYRWKRVFPTDVSGD